jgi:hypothetical protein
VATMRLQVHLAEKVFAGGSKRLIFAWTNQTIDTTAKHITERYGILERGELLNGGFYIGNEMGCTADETLIFMGERDDEEE